MYNTIIYLKKNSEIKRKSKCVYYDKRFSTCVLTKSYCESSILCKKYSVNKTNINTKKLKKINPVFNIHSVKINSSEKICFNYEGKIDECVLVVNEYESVHTKGIEVRKYKLKGVNKKIRVFLYVSLGELHLTDMYSLKRNGCSYELTKL